MQSDYPMFNQSIDEAQAMLFGYLDSHANVFFGSAKDNYIDDDCIDIDDRTGVIFMNAEMFILACILLEATQNYQFSATITEKDGSTQEIEPQSSFAKLFEAFRNLKEEADPEQTFKFDFHVSNNRTANCITIPLEYDYYAVNGDFLLCLDGSRVDEEPMKQDDMAYQAFKPFLDDILFMGLYKHSDNSLSIPF